MHRVGTKLDIAATTTANTATAMATATNPNPNANHDQRELPTGRVVSTAEGQAWAEAHAGAGDEAGGVNGFCEASAKAGENACRPFVELVDWIVQRHERGPAFLGGTGARGGSGSGTVSIVGKGEREGWFGGCAS